MKIYKWVPIASASEKKSKLEASPGSTAARRPPTGSGVAPVSGSKSDKENSQKGTPTPPQITPSYQGLTAEDSNTCEYLLHRLAHLSQKILRHCHYC